MLDFTTISQAKKQTGLAYLGKVNNSSKLAKNGKISGQHTYIIYLAPAKTSGYNVCHFSTPECRLGCLATSGRAAMEILSNNFNRIENSRIKKTKMFYEQPEFFMSWLIAEIKASQIKAIELGFEFSIRLNGTSDIDWQNVKVDGKSIFEIFPDVQFYDYTKSHLKFIDKPKNYHLTYSYTGRNWNHCKGLLSKGHNIAMVFNIKRESELPTEFKGFKVSNGDLTDFRVSDGKSVIVGLKWKRIANREAEQKVLNSCFVVNSNVHELV